MIATLTGTLTRKSPTEIVVTAGGLGYAVSIPLSTFERLPEVGSEAFLFTHLHVREDLMQLFGFATEVERDVFKMLISVTGIGPRMAQGILSGMAVDDLRAAIGCGNHAALTTIPGVGRKLAERLVLELRDKMVKSDLTAGTSSGAPSGPAGVRSEALLALTSLGYNRAIADKALRAALDESHNGTPTLQELIKAALKHASGK